MVGARLCARSVNDIVTKYIYTFYWYTMFGAKAYIDRIWLQAIWCAQDNDIRFSLTRIIFGHFRIGGREAAGLGLGLGERCSRRIICEAVHAQAHTSRFLGAIIECRMRGHQTAHKQDAWCFIHCAKRIFSHTV